MPNFHAQTGSDAAANDSQSQERGFGDSLLVASGFPLVDAVQKESDHVDDQKTYQDNMQEVQIFHHYAFVILLQRYKIRTESWRNWILNC